MTSDDSRIKQYLHRGFALSLIIATLLFEVSCVKSIATAEPFPTKTNMEMVLIPAGSFLMGIDGNDLDQRPQHEVYLDAYWMDLTEVTNTQYLACVDAGGCKPPGEAQYYREQALGSHPVAYVTWQDARDFCQWAGKRLPTEAEWEKAARGEDGRKYPWGNETPTGILANFDECNDGTTKVGRFLNGASPYGVLDMAGNVWEWVADWYDARYYQTSPAQNPTGPASGTKRVLRGGSWNSDELYMRASNRHWYYPDLSNLLNGFRCATSPDL